MAEGDSLVRIARKLRPVMLDREIVAASAPNQRSSLRVHARRLEGRTVESIETRGKHLLIHLDEGLSLHSHLGMNGGWRVDDGRGFGKPDRLAWLLLELEEAGDDGSAHAGAEARPSAAGDPRPLIRVGQFGGTTLRLVRTAELARDSRLALLGPDILGQDFDLESAAARIRSSPDEIGVTLLDQRLVCGIGNIFKSEACFEAGIDPWRPAASLAVAGGGAASAGSPEVDDESAEESRDEAIRLLQTARQQMQAAVETGRRPGRIYKKAGRPCFRCRRARIRSRGQGEDNRTTYWCPNCQT